VEKKWYVLRTYSGHENKVKAYIENEVTQSGLEDRVASVIVPSEKVIEVKDKKKRSKTRTFGPKNEPAPLQPAEVRRLIGRIEEKRSVEVMEVPFKAGDAVKVTDGPFTSFNGFVQEVNEEKMKLKVMVSIFGRKTPLELDFSQVEAEK
jgi:transcriptional antiterminator NusG